MRRNITIPIVTMADIAFLLLIFLLLIGITEQTKEIPVKLPEIREISKIGLKKAQHIFVTKEGNLFFGGKKMDLAELELELEKKTAINKEVVIFIHSDEETEYQYIAKIIELLKRQYLKNCVFVCQKQKT